MTVTLSLWNDIDCENPSEWDGWKVHSFSDRHINFKHPNELGILRDGSSNQIGMRRKLDVGTAFVLSCFQHGNSVWTLRGEGPQCQWDNCSVAGVIAWEENPKNLGAKTYEERAADARAFLETYTKWCNGTCYGYTIENEDGDEPSCGGFYDEEQMFEEIRADLKDVDPKDVVVEGDASWLTGHHSWQPKEDKSPCTV